MNTVLEGIFDKLYDKIKSSKANSDEVLNLDHIIDQDTPSELTPEQQAEVEEFNTAVHSEDPMEQMKVVSSKSIFNRLSLLDNKHLHNEVLDALANDSQEYIRNAVAKDNRATPEILDRLARDPEAFIKYSVIENPNTSIDTLMMLASDPDVSIRKKLASSDKLNDEIYNKLVNDPAVAVQQAVKNNNFRTPSLFDSTQENIEECGFGGGIGTTTGNFAPAVINTVYPKPKDKTESTDFDDESEQYWVHSVKEPIIVPEIEKKKQRLQNRIAYYQRKIDEVNANITNIMQTAPSLVAVQRVIDQGYACINRYSKRINELKQELRKWN